MFLTCHRVHEALAGRTLVRGELRHPRPATTELTGRAVHEVRPVGKHLLIRFDDATTLHNHLRMDGAWHLYPPGARWRRPAHQVRAVLAVDEQVAVGFSLHDMRLLPTAEEHRLVASPRPRPAVPRMGRGVGRGGPAQADP